MALYSNPYYHVAIPIVLAVAMNAWIYSIGLNKYSDREKPNPLIPPGYIIATIWTVLFGLMGYTHYLLGNPYSLASMSIVVLITFSILYPVFTGLRKKSGLLLNLVALILSFTSAILVYKESVYAFYWLIPLLAWTIYVNAAFVIECSDTAVPLRRK
jgi:tryptophan-rich sensory protein